MSATVAEAAVARRRPRPLARLRARVGTAGAIATGFLALLALVALLAPLIAPHDPLEQNLTATFADPSGAHLLGTDALGRDVLSRLMWGTRTSLLGPVLVIGLAVAVGTPLAIASAWHGGKVDLVVGRFLDVLFAFPGILLAVLAVALFGPGLVACSLALGIAYMPWLARVTRGAALRERGKPYIAAGEVQGLSGLVLCARHILPNITPLIVAQATVSFGYAFVDLAALSFLGFGVQPPATDWGQLVNSQDAILQGHPEQALYAGGLIVGCVIAVTILGNRLSEDDARPGR
jgi:peptide/nickel transport system permease protein